MGRRSGCDNPAILKSPFATCSPLRRAFFLPKIGVCGAAMTDAWLMLAFPDAGVGAPAPDALRSFALSKSKKSWWRLLATREEAIAIKRRLVSAGIRYACKKVVERPKPPK